MSGTRQADDGSIERALRLVRLLASAGSRGLALTDLARRAGLPVATGHRLLQRLVAERLVRRLATNRRYGLGPLAFELGLAASPQFDLRGLCSPVLAPLAERVDSTVYLTIRSGLEAVCTDRYEGRGAIRVLEIEVGSRRPLGLGAGGLALLAAFQPEECQALIEQIGDWPMADRPRPVDLREAVATTRRNGYSLVHDRVTPGITAVGVAVCAAPGMPLAAISVAGIHERMTRSLIESHAERLRTAARAIEKTLQRRARA